jgi:hypothetical protein
LATFARNLQGGRINGQDSPKETAKTRRPLDLGGVAPGLSRKEQRKIPEIRSSGYRSFRGRGTLVERNRD